MSKEETIRFTALGCDVRYEINGDGTHEQLWFDDVMLVDSFGEVGPYRSKKWQESLILHGAARSAVWQKLLREHAEYLLADALRGIPRLYEEINKELILPTYD